MTTLVAGTRGDALRVLFVGDDVQSLAVVGTIRGLIPLAAAGACGEGSARVRSLGSPPTRFSFRAPGSSTWGEAIVAEVSGDYLLEDGSDRSKWLRARVRTDWLASQPEEAPVFLRDRFNELGPDDVTAAEAASGSVEVLALELANVSTNRLDLLKSWIAPATSNIEVSPDGISWSAPTTEGTALALGSLDYGATLSFYVRRTITIGAASAAKLLNQLRFSWRGA